MKENYDSLIVLSKIKKAALLILFILIASYSNAQCQALELVSNNTAQCQPALFKWVVKNAPAGSTFTWDFGNKPQQGQDTFYAFIQAAGKVLVTVNIKFPDNKVCIISKQNFVEVYAKPIPTFYASRNKLCNGADTITYFDITKNTAKRSWVIDGVNYNNAMVKQKHSYTSTGIKKLSLIVEDKKGCKAIKEFDSIAIIHKNISIDFMADNTSGCVAQKVKFKILINNQGQKIENYKWTFPGGLPASQFTENPDTIIYKAAGIFSPVLEIRAENGCVKSYTKTNYLTFGILDTLSIKISDTSICQGESIIIENLDKKLKGTFKWELPESSLFESTDPFTCNATYNKTGKYDVNVVYNYNGCTVAKSFLKAIRVKAVHAEFNSKDYWHCLLPHTVHFANLSKSDDPGKISYKWMIYTNNNLIQTSNNINDSFKLPAEGIYDVWLLARHENGCTDIFKEENYIRNGKIKPHFNALFKVGCINQEISFTHQTNFSSYKSPDRFTWTFYDNKGTKVLGKYLGEHPKFSYPDTGIYTVKVVSDNGIGCKDSIIKTNFIEIVKPKIGFALSNPVLCNNEILIGGGLSEPSRARFNYSWHLQRINGEVKINVLDSAISIPLGQAGEYKLKLIHSINNGCKDSIINNNLIKVNGVNARINLDTFNGCTPLKVKPAISINENFHFGNTDYKLKYKWSCNPSTNVTINNDGSPIPEFIFAKTGEYTISVELTNSTNCKFTLSSQLIFVGVKAAFEASDYTVCANQEIILSDFSYLKPTSIKWITGADAIPINQNKGISTQNKFKFNTEGNHKIGIVANKFNKCFDTAYKNIKSINIKADFISLETEIKCAPVYAQFESHSKYADSLYWNFGDGNFATTTDSMVANIYRKNTETGKGYSIELIASSNEGCSDTLTRFNYQKVTGPVPNFDIINNIGCEPLRVGFINKSKDAFINYINYGDGSPLDSSLNIHDYTLKSTDVDSQYYDLKMYSIDSLGCKAECDKLKTVMVKANTKAAFTVSDSIICENQTVKINPNHLLNTTDNFYINDLAMNKTAIYNDQFNFIKAGEFEIVKVQKNQINCSDSAKVKIRVNPNPTSAFTLMDSTCLNKMVNFTGLSNGKESLEYTWEISNAAVPIIYSGKNIMHIFENPGNANVKLTTTNIYKCKTTMIKTFAIANPDSTPAGHLKLVSINENNTVKIISNPVTYNHFVTAKYYFHDDKMENIHTSNKALSESFEYYSSKKIDTSLCFDMRLINHCGFESGMGKKHCTIFLKVNSHVAFTNQLTWTPYIGWTQNFTYNIFRKAANQSTYFFIGKTSSEHTSYLDTNLCDMGYNYFIEAVSNDLRSMSNSVSNKPLFIYPNEFSSISSVSVNYDNSIQIKWPISKSSAIDKYTLLKSSLVENKTYSFDLVSNFYRDYEVNANENNYVYHVIETDKCGNKSKPSYEGKNIVLVTNSTNYRTSANWNTYKNWKSGVKSYSMQIEKNGGFKTIYQTTDSDSLMLHDQSLENIHGPYCYRVMAVSGDAKDTSYSNISCVVSASTLFMPNAFSPNGDGINEKIGAKSLFVENNSTYTGRNFSLEIFNRWGEKLFATNDIDEEWDGTYGGKPVQKNVYSYRLKAMGIDNRSYSLSGTITIIP